MRHSLLIVLFISLFVFKSSAQRHNFLSRSELGLMIGGMYYLGDLNPMKQFNLIQSSGGLLFRHSIHSRVSYRASIILGSVKADDQFSSNELLKNRNLSFSSTIYELSTGVEFNYLPFEVGHQKYKGTAYLMIGLGLFQMNPTTEFNGDKIELQPLGTEGQSSNLSSKSIYSLTQVTIPFGVGLRATLAKRTSINLEFAVRKTFTDYLDDVHSDSYVYATDLANANGPIAGSLSNRSLNGDPYGKRGDSSTKDWYVFTGVSIMFNLGNPSSCFYFK